MGVATSNKSLVRGLVVVDKVPRVNRYHEATIHSFLELITAAGLNGPEKLSRNHISKRISIYNVQTYIEIYLYIEEGCLVKVDTVPEAYKKFF